MRASDWVIVAGVVAALAMAATGFVMNSDRMTGAVLTALTN